MPVETPRFTRALEAELRERATTRRRRRRMPAGGVAIALAVTIAFAFIVLPSHDERGEQAAPPPKPLTVSAGDIMRADRAGVERLRAEFAARGKKLVIRERPVAPGSEYVGRVVRYEVFQPRAGEPIHVDRLRTPVIVTVGVASTRPQVRHAPYVCETLPQLVDLVDGHDAKGSIKRLRQAGFEIRVKRLRWDAPTGNTVMGIFGPDGRADSITPRTRKLTIVVGSPGRYNDGAGGC
jgi:hypothetical protein